MTEQRSAIIKADPRIHCWFVIKALTASLITGLLLVVTPLVTHAQEFPDLVVTSISGPAVAQTEEQIVIQTTVRNQGTGGAEE
ncbi:MAG: CARDB domain-containing protein, partial [Candidatus Thorarchaeota archaeon]